MKERFIDYFFEEEEKEDILPYYNFLFKLSIVSAIICILLLIF